jgi:hypothetical protein
VKRIVFVMACAFAAICVVAAVYSSIPGVPHPFVVSGSGKAFLVNPAAQPLAASYPHHNYSAAGTGRLPEPEAEGSRQSRLTRI